MFVTKCAIAMSPLSVPLAPIRLDWFGIELSSPPLIGCAIDPQHFHLRASRAAPGTVHPDAKPGCFTPNLWQYDAVEFFLVDPENGHSLEFNLAPNGAWWSCEFTAPRQRAQADDEPFPGVTTTGQVRRDSWEATASLPLDQLRERFHFGPSTRFNTNATLLNPGPTFLTAAPLGPGKPDFHQPGRLPRIRMQTSDNQ